MEKPDRTPLHDAFSDEIERLVSIGCTDAVEKIAHMLVRHMTATQLEAARQDVNRAEGLDIPASPDDREEA
jgi:hypothetical protein